MADEVLKLIVTADTSKVTTELKNVEAQVKKVGDATQKATARPTTGADIFASIQASAAALSQQMAGTSAATASNLATIEKGAAGIGQAFTAAGFSAETALQSLGGPLGVVTGAIVLQTAAIGAFNTALVEAGIKFHDVMAILAGRTGETGEALQGLGEDFRTVFASVPQSATEVTDVIAKLHQRFELTGASLQEVSRQMLNFSRITGTPVKAAMDSLVEVMSSWDLTAKDMPKLMDMLTVAFQRSGVEVPKMAGYLENNDAALKQFGFSLAESVALIATLEKRGVNVQKIMTGFNKAAPAFAEAGIDPKQGFQDAIRLIQELDNEQALLVAKQTFGTKVAVEFADAIRSGAFEISGMQAALEESAGALDVAASHSMTFTDQLNLMKNAAQSLLMPLGSELVNTVSKYALPAFTALAFKLSETVYWMEYLAGINPTLSKFDLQKAGVSGTAPALSPTQIAELSGKTPTRKAGTGLSFTDYMSKLKDKGSAGTREKEIDPEKFDRDFRAAELRIFESADRAGDQFQKNWITRLRGSADLSLRELQNHEKAANEILKQNGEIRVLTASTEAERVMAQHELDRQSFLESELFKTATAEQQAQLRANFEEVFQAQQDAKRRGRIESLRDDISVLAAETGAPGRESGELARLASQQQIELRKASAQGADAGEITLIQQRQGLEVLKLQQQQYDTMFGRVKTQAEGVFDAIFLRGKKGFAGLLDYIKGTFITGLKDLFGNVVATLFTGSRPGGGSAATGGIFGGLANAFGGLFGGGRSGGGGGGLFGSLGGLFGGGGGIAGTPPFLPARGGFGGFGGLGSLLGLGGAGAGIAGGGGIAATAAGELALPTTFSALTPETLGGAGAAAGGGSFFGLSGATLGAFFTNPFTIAAGIGIATTIAFLKLRKTREEKFRAEILRDFAINVPDNKILKQIKNLGESVFGKEADKKRFETLRLDQVQGLLLNYATASGQDPSRLPIYRKFYGGGLGTAARSISFDPSRGVPAFGSGGIVTQPTLALVGERGPERIVPFAQSGGGGGLVTVNYAPVIHMVGGDPKQMERLFDRHRREIGKAVDKAINGDFRRGNILSGLIGT